MQRPRGRSNAIACALALLAVGLFFPFAAPYSLGNPHHFEEIAPASVAVAAEDEFNAVHGLQSSTGARDTAVPGLLDSQVEQYYVAQRDELVARACEILTQPETPTIAVSTFSVAEIVFDGPSHSESIREGEASSEPKLSQFGGSAGASPSHFRDLSHGSEAFDAEIEFVEDLPPHVQLIDDYDNCPCNDWTWQWLPTGLIYRSYMAGVHEPRAAIVAFHEGEERTLWDATLGGRFGILRCGDCDPLRPQGWQVDFYGAAIARLDVEHQQDLDSTDYVFGVPLTYGIGAWQFKLGYAHLSSHLGDELALRDPVTLDERRNYVRDAIVFGTSCFVNPVWRQYGEVGWAFHHSGGAQPWEAQIGTELSRPGPGPSPFFAVNGRMREEHHFGGDVTVQAGWLRRGGFGQTMRVGAHYYNGKSSQFQFFDQAEEQVGLGLWYDF